MLRGLRRLRPAAGALMVIGLAVSCVNADADTCPRPRGEMPTTSIMFESRRRSGASAQAGYSGTDKIHRQPDRASAVQ